MSRKVTKSEVKKAKKAAAVKAARKTAASMRKAGYKRPLGLFAGLKPGELRVINMDELEDHVSYDFSELQENRITPESIKKELGDVYFPSSDKTYLENRGSVIELISKYVGKTIHLANKCVETGLAASDILKIYDIDHKLVTGYAAFRAGSERFAAAIYHPEFAFNPMGIYHVWIELGDGSILDFTTAKLEKALKEMDAADGMKTTCEWSPDYVLLEKGSWKKSVVDVEIGKVPGMVYYEKKATIRDVVSRFETYKAIFRIGTK